MNHEQYMRRALELAMEAQAEGETPPPTRSWRPYGTHAPGPEAGVFTAVPSM